MELRGTTRQTGFVECKRYSQRNHYTTVKMAPCKICGGKSSGFHFGVITCEACKAFFRRAMINKSTYECTRGSKCSERNGNLIGCSACRLKRCLTAGMSKRGVRKGRYSIALRTQAILEAIATEQEMACDANHSRPATFGTPRHSPIPSPPYYESTPPPSVTSSAPVSPMSSESSLSPPPATTEASQWQTNHRILLACLSPSGLPTCKVACRGACSRHRRVTTRCDTPPFTEDQGRSLDEIIYRVAELQKAIYPNYRMSGDTREPAVTLQEYHLKREQAHAYLFERPYSVIRGDSDPVLVGTNVELEKRLSSFRKIAMETETDIALYVDHVQRLPGFKQLNKSDLIKLLKSSYNEFWLFSNFESMTVHGGDSSETDNVMNAHKKVMGTLSPKNHVDAVHRFAGDLKKLALSPTEISIIRVLLLTFTDRTFLKEPKQVQDIHDTFMNCLLHHLNKSTVDPGRRLTKIVDKLVAARSITYMNLAVNEQFLRNWGFLMHDYPLWREMMVFDDTATSEILATI